MLTAESIARSLGGVARTGTGWVARCPVPRHGRGRGDRNPSLSVRDGDNGPLVYCHGGCPQDAVIDALKDRGLWESQNRTWGAAKVAKVAKVLPNNDNGKWARTLWRQSLPPEGTPVEAYLRHRGFTGPIPPTIRFLPDTKHPSGTRHPAMIAAVTIAPHKEVVAVHRTFLRLGGAGKADVDRPKMALGPITGGAVRLAPATGHLAVAEGIESGLAVLAETGLPTWTALSAGGIRNLVLPPLPLASEVTVAADNDPVGIAAAEHAAERWHREGRTVRIAVPDTPGADFNDLALAPSVRREVAA